MDVKEILPFLIVKYQKYKKDKIAIIILIVIEIILIYKIPLNKLESILNCPEKVKFIIDYFSFIFFYPAWTKTILFLVLATLTIRWWLFNSGRLVKPSDRFIVAFALESDDIESRKIQKKSLKKLSKKLDDLKVLENFKFIEIGIDLFSTNSEAETYIKRKAISLVVHGNISTEKVNSKKVFSLKDFKFSYQYHCSTSNNELKNRITNDIDLMLSHRNWIIEDDNSHKGFETITRNFVEVLVSIIAISSVFNRNLTTTSITLLENLIPYMNKYLTPNSVKFDIDKNKLSIPLHLLRCNRLKSILVDSYSFLSYSETVNKNYKNAIDIIHKAINFGSNKSLFNATLSYCYYKIGKVDLAKQYNENMKNEKDQKTEYYTNKAFFAIIDRDVESMISYYDKLKNRKKYEGYYEKIINFLKEEKGTNNNELLDYGIAILTYSHICKDKGRKLLIAFIKDYGYPEIRKKIGYILKLSNGEPSSTTKDIL
ncbi:hypothetical protein JEZ13_03190 [bacterium]|nr:hypothetical protein [bacterium]